MVQVTLQTAPRLRLTAEGHAGGGAYGRDLVCAGVSTLICTLAARLETEAHPYQSVLKPGYACLQAEVTPSAAAAFLYAKTGLRLLAEQYPQCVRIRENPG